MRTTGLMVAGGLMGVVVAGGCVSSPPMGQPGGRVEVSNTTAAERGSRLVTTNELQEFRDSCAEQLVRDITELPEFQEYRVTIVFGDLVNNTGIVPTTDFEAFRTGLRGKLINSAAVRNRVRWIEGKAKWEELRRKELGSGQDLLQEKGRAGSGDRKLNEEYTFFLNGEMTRIARGGDQVQLYAMAFSLMRASDSEIVWQNTPYESKRIVGR